MSVHYSDSFLDELFAIPELEELLEEIELPEDKKPIVSFNPADDRERELKEWIDKNGRLPSDDSNDPNEVIMHARLEAIESKKTQSNKEESDAEVLAKMLDQIDLGPDLSDFSNVEFEPKTEKVKPDYISRRRPCKNFSEYEPLFKGVEKAIEKKTRKVVPFSASQMKEGRFFIVGGLLCFVVEIFEKEINSFGRQDFRLHLVFANGTESNMLFSTFQKIMSDEFGRYVEEEEISADEFELENTPEKESRKFEIPDIKSGYIYILKSLSEEDTLKPFNGNLYKIGVTKGTDPGAVQKRIQNASNETTYLCAPVKVVEQWQCININSTAFETLLHNFLRKGRVNIKVKGKDGEYYNATEWFNVPLKAIEDTASLFFSNELHNYRYDSKRMEVVKK